VKSLPILISTKESDFSRSIDGKTSWESFVCGMKDAEGRIQIYVARDDISTDEENNVQCCFQETMDIGDFIGVRGTVFRTQVGEISVHIYGLTVLAKALKPLPVVKQMLTVKRTMHLQMRNKGTVVVTWI
jgi:lysyl-tRNA synthetase class II